MGQRSAQKGVGLAASGPHPDKPACPKTCLTQPVTPFLNPPAAANPAATAARPAGTAATPAVELIPSAAAQLSAGIPAAAAQPAAEPAGGPSVTLVEPAPRVQAASSGRP